MSSRRILFFAVASIFVLAVVGRYAGEDEAVPAEATGDLNHLSEQSPAAQPPTISAVQQADPVQATAATPAPALTPQETQKLELLREVIKTGKDNDPRVDTELKELSPALKAAIKKEYQQLPKEHRNGRGFIAFLIGRSMSEPGDIEFLEQVVAEPPCQSFQDCDAKGPVYEEAEEHSTNVSLNYPQIVATRMLKQNLTKNSNWITPAMRAKITEALEGSRY